MRPILAITALSVCMTGLAGSFSISWNPTEPPSAVTNSIAAAASVSTESMAKTAAAEAAKAAASEISKALTKEKTKSDVIAAKREEEKFKREILKMDREAERENREAVFADSVRTLRQIDTKIFRLNHASSAEVAQKLNEMWNGEFGQEWKVSKMAVAFPESNSVMITAPRLILQACEKAVAELDVEAQQVYIEARFVELGNTASHKLGIDWSMLDSMKGSLSMGGGLETLRLGDGVNSYDKKTTSGNDTISYAMNGGNGGVRYFSGTLNFSEMYLIMRALDSMQDAKTFSNPKIIVSSGKRAIVDMTKKYPNVKISAKRTVSSNNDSLDLDMSMAEIPGEDKFMFAKEAFFSWGIQLEVTPRISTNGIISVQIVPTISDCEEFVSATDDEKTTYSSKYPIINVQRLVTEFNMASETTAVIGGLSRTVETQVDNGIPWLKDWWWIGPRLFSSKVRIKEQREIIVFVTVGLVNPRSMKQDAGLPKNAILGRQILDGKIREPGDLPEQSLESMKLLDLRSIEEQKEEQSKQPQPAPKKPKKKK